MVQLYVLSPDGKLSSLCAIEEDKVIDFLIQLFEKVPTNYTIAKINDATVRYEVSFDKETRIIYCVNEP